MNRTRGHLGCSTLIGLVGLISAAGGGCLRESHVLGEGPGDGGPPTASAGDDAVARVEAGTHPGDALDDSGNPPPILPDMDGGGATPGTATVVSLGDVGSSGWPIAIAPAEVATRLSLLLLRQPASATLTAAVMASSPRTNEDVGKLTDGLLLEDGSLAGRQAFYRWWLNLDDFLTGARDASLFPGLTDQVRQALVDGTTAFIEDVTWRPTGDLATLLTEPTAFVSSATAPWFPGVAVPAGTAGVATRVSLDASAYAGIVTQPAALTIYDYPYRADPTMRGLQVRRTYLCQDLPPVPPGERSGGLFGAGVTIRQGISASTSTPACAPCHGLTDEVGFAFGHFDAVGAYHDTEGGLPVDTTGTLTGTSVDPPAAFDGPVDLAATLAALPEVRTCFAVKWLLFATGQTPQAYTTNITPSGQDVQLVRDAAYVVARATLPGGRLSLRGTIRAVTETHSFLDP
jgi:hypothetical protein